MTDTKIATDYLTDLFAKLAAGDLDPAHVDWPFAAEAWQAVRREAQRLRTEVKHHRQDKDLLAEELKELRFRAAEVERCLGMKEEVKSE